MNLIISTVQDTTNYPINKSPALLTCPNGEITLLQTIKCIHLENIHTIYIVILKNLVEEYFKLEDFERMFSILNKKIKIDYIENKTSCQAMTIYDCVKRNNIRGSICVKDYNTLINFKPVKGNYIYYIDYDRDNTDKITNIDKSYIKFNNLKQIINISDKESISNHICIGAYIFEDVNLFIKAYEDIIDISKEPKIYICHTIYWCILSKIFFYANKVTDFVDLSFYENWLSYRNSYKTLFVDIDGTLVVNSGEYSKKKWGETDMITENVEFLKQLYKGGKTQIILTTARKEKYRRETLEQLKRFSIPYDKIIFDLFHCKRYLINDFAPTNPYPSAISLNLKRNDNNLKDLLS